MKTLKEFRLWLDDASPQVIQARMDEFSGIHQHKTIDTFLGHIQLLLKGGKRIRPFFCYLGTQCDKNTNPEKYLEVFIGLEIFHVFCLIHDDIIDQSHLRRGQSSLHRFIEQKIGESGRAQRQKIVSEGQAILLGDLLFAWAQDLFFTAPDQARKEISAMITEVVAGQMIDVQTSLEDNVSMETIERKMHYKTASYTFIRPFRIGLQLAGMSEKDIEQNSQFTEALGIAFQIQDDYLDLIGDPARTGKPRLADVREGQHTLFSQHIMTHGTEELAQSFRELFGNLDADDDQLNRLQEQLISSDILQPGKTQFEALYEKAAEQLQSTNLPEEVKQQLTELIERLKNRTS